jgi:hypothetical protein
MINTFSHTITSLNEVAVSPAGWVAAPDFLQSVINRIVWDSAWFGYQAQAEYGTLVGGK